MNVKHIKIDDGEPIDLTCLPEEDCKRLVQHLTDSIYQQGDLEKPYHLMQLTLDALRTKKPNDRSEADRNYAIAITDCQRLIGFFKTYVVDREAHHDTPSVHQIPSE